MERMLYCVSHVSQTIGVEVSGRKYDIDLSWAKGMIGAIPVFDNKEDARAAAGSGEIWTVTTPAEISKQEGAEG